MSVVVVGLNHRTVPLALLERVTIDDARLPKALHDVLSQDHVSEAVVRRDRVGRGLGTLLLREALVELSKLGADVVFIDRHEENLASAGMMRAAGFVEIETYADPRRRPHGSGRTTVCWKVLNPAALPARIV